MKEQVFDDGYTKILKLVERVDSELVGSLNEVLKAFSTSLKSHALINKDYNYSNSLTGVEISLMFMPDDLYFEFSNKKKEYDVELFIKKVYEDDLIEGFVEDESSVETDEENEEEEDENVECIFSLTITTRNNVGIDWAVHIREEDDGGYIMTSTKTRMAETLYQKYIYLSHEDMLNYVCEGQHNDIEIKEVDDESEEDIEFDGDADDIGYVE